MDTLSELAAALFRLLVEKRGQIGVDDPTRKPYPELFEAGQMMDASTLRDVKESISRPTQAGF